MSGMPDSSPSKAPSNGKTGDHPNGMKNKDSRLGGSKWDNDASPFGGQDGVPSFEAKAVDSMPNEGLKEIVSNGTKGLGKIV